MPCPCSERFLGLPFSTLKRCSARPHTRRTASTSPRRPTMRSASSSSSTGCVQPSLRHLARRLAGKKPIDESRRCWPLPLPFVSRMAARLAARRRQGHKGDRSSPRRLSGGLRIHEARRLTSRQRMRSARSSRVRWPFKRMKQNKTTSVQQTDLRLTEQHTHLVRSDFSTIPGLLCRAHGAAHRRREAARSRLVCCLRRASAAQES